MAAGVAAYAADVRGRRYPEPRHGYSIAAGELQAFREHLT
jgi:ketopantoate hydroxymethyltransferase